VHRSQVVEDCIICQGGLVALHAAKQGGGPHGAAMMHRQALAPGGVIEPVGAWFCERCRQAERAKARAALEGGAIDD
jgi:hypothetical protein